MGRDKNIDIKTNANKTSTEFERKLVAPNQGHSCAENLVKKEGNR